MQRVIAMLAFLASLALTVQLAVVPASADPPGNNGTIKIHDANEDEPMRANEPHPGCTFHVHGFTFDSSSSGTWSIASHPPTGDGTTVMSGTWTANASGEWRTSDISTLASGHYKASAKQDGTPGGEKHKVFWVECGGQQPGQNASPSPAVAGFEQAPQAGVSPIVESPMAPMTFEQAVANQAAQAQLGAQQAPAPAAPVIAGQQAVPIQQLPSTSTAP